MRVRAALTAIVLAVTVAVPASVVPSAAAAPAETGHVVPVDWSDFRPAPRDPEARLTAAILNSAAKYALTVWYPETYGDQTGDVLDLGGTAEPNIRPPAGEAFALAVALGTGAYDAGATGVSEAEAREVATRLAASVAAGHVANGAGGWGDDWQTALWAYYAGFAGWLLWDDLTAAQRAGITAMVVHEADRFQTYRVPYYRDADGSVLTPGDSKAEENAWNADLLQLATAMMPLHPHWTAWMGKNVELMLSAFARPSDVERGTVVNGRPVRDWLDGSNIAEDGTLVNHGFIHPDYMATVAENTGAPLAYALAGQPTPRAAFWNADLVYDSLVDLDFPSPPYRDPGGTVYTRTADGTAGPGVFYPQGNDWGTSRRMHFALVDTQADLFGFDGDASVPAAGWAHEHAATVRSMQQRFDDGRTYGEASEDTYSGREQWVAFMAAATYLTRWVAHQGPVDVTNRPYPAPAELTVTGPDLQQAGTTGTVEARVRNADRHAIRDVTVRLSAPAGWSARADGATRWRELRAGGSATAAWRVRAPDDAEPGTYTLAATVTYRQGERRVEVPTDLRIDVPPPAPTGDTWVSDLTWLRASNGYGPAFRDRNYYGDPLVVDGTTYAKGLWTNAPASLTYHLGGRCTQLTADLGIDDSMRAHGEDRGSVVYRVLVDGTAAYTSPRLTGSAPATALAVDVSGARLVELVVDDGGDGKSYDHADWAGARLACG